MYQKIFLNNIFCPPPCPHPSGGGRKNLISCKSIPIVQQAFFA